MNHGLAFISASLGAVEIIIQHAVGLGINLFDTAQGYGFGVAEQLLADALRGRTKREDVVIATKGGLRKDGDHLLRDASRKSLREGVESSLPNLRTDYIDIFHVHWPDLHTPPEEPHSSTRPPRRQTSRCPRPTFGNAGAEFQLAGSGVGRLPGRPGHVCARS